MKGFIRTLLPFAATILAFVTTSRHGQSLEGFEEGGKRKRRRLNAGCINCAVEAILPTVNAILQEKIEDPGNQFERLKGFFCNKGKIGFLEIIMATYSEENAAGTPIIFRR